MLTACGKTWDKNVQVLETVVNNVNMMWTTFVQTFPHTFYMFVLMFEHLRSFVTIFTC